jgi:hypothetical protein
MILFALDLVLAFVALVVVIALVRGKREETINCLFSTEEVTHV